MARNVFNDVFVWSVLSFNILSSISDLILLPQDVEVLKGQTVTLPCSTSFVGTHYVHWYRSTVGSSGMEDIYFSTLINHKYAGKIGINKDEAKGEYNLTINSVEPQDAGTYTCQDRNGSGHEHRAEVVVLDAPPTGNSNIDLDSFGVCGAEAEVDYIVATCQLNYTGNTYPVITWRVIFKDGSSRPVSSDIPPNISPTSVIYQLEVKPEAQMDGSQLVCETTLAKYKWTSNEVKVQYATSVAVSKDEDQMLCKANSSVPCTYSWVSLDDGRKVDRIYSDILRRGDVGPGKYQCTVECNIYKKPCLFSSIVEEFEKEEGGNSTWIIVVAVIVAVLIVAAVLISGSVCYRRRSVNSYHLRKLTGRERTGSPENVPLLSDEPNVTPSSAIEQFIVRGMTELDRHIYVVFQDKNFIRIFEDGGLFSMAKNDIALKHLKDPWNLESCSNNGCLYVADRNPNNCIWKVSVADNDEVHRLSDLKEPHKFSVTPDGRIVIPKWPGQIEILAPDGSTERTINLPSDMPEPYYALQTPRNSFVVAHGHQITLKHRVCEVTEEGDCEELWSYPMNEEEKIDNIDILAMDNFGRIFVTDQNNQRIILLDKNGVNITSVKIDMLPYRLCYGKDSQLLFVGHFGSISVYSVSTHENKTEIQFLRRVVCERYPFENISMTADNPQIQLQEVLENFMTIDEYTVRGITELEDKFYVIFQNQNFIRVFDKSGQFSDVEVKELSEPWFIDACSENRCLYVADKKRKCILKVILLRKELDGEFQHQEKEPQFSDVITWQNTLKEPFKLCVISNRRILIPQWPSTLEIYQKDGQLEATIALPEDFLEPCQALQTDDGHFIVSHGDKKSTGHSVFKLQYSSGSGCKVAWEYGGKRGNKELELNRPRNIALDRQGRIFVADEADGGRITLLDENGNRLDAIKMDVKPQTIYYSQTMKRLLVGHYGSVTQYSVDEEGHLKSCCVICP